MGKKLWVRPAAEEEIQTANHRAGKIGNMTHIKTEPKGVDCIRCLYRETFFAYRYRKLLKQLTNARRELNLRNKPLVERALRKCLRFAKDIAVLQRLSITEDERDSIEKLDKLHTEFLEEIVVDKY